MPEEERAVWRGSGNAIAVRISGAEEVMGWCRSSSCKGHNANLSLGTVSLFEACSGIRA